MTLGEKIKQARIDANLTQEELASKLTVSRQAISKWESDKGMPDIGNLKAMAGLLNVSVDYLLDDGSTLDLGVTREAIDLSGCGTGSKKCRKNRIVCEKYPGAEIFMLMPQRKLTKGKKIIDRMVFLLTDLPGAGFEIAHSIDELGTEYYLVNRGSEQYLVSVSDEFLESRRLAERISGKKFTLGEHIFRIVRRDIARDCAK